MSDPSFKDIERIVTGKVDDDLEIMSKFKDDYEPIKERELLFKRIIYLNGATFVVGVQGTGKTYLVKSILNNKEVNDEINNIFWIDTPNDVVFLQKWFEYKKVCFEGMYLLFQNKLKGEYFNRWEEITSRQHMEVNKERFDFLPFDPLKFDIIVVDDVAKFPDLRLILPYCTILRHIHCGIIFISQTEGILPKAFRDLTSIFITFNIPETKMLTNAKMRKEVSQIILSKRNKREAVLVDLVDNQIKIITAEDIKGKEEIEEKPVESGELTEFKRQLDSVNV